MKGSYRKARDDLKLELKSLFRSVYEDGRDVMWDSPLYDNLNSIIDVSVNDCYDELLKDFVELNVAYVKAKIPKNSFEIVDPIFDHFSNYTSANYKVADKKMRLFKSGYIRLITKINKKWLEDSKKYFPDGRLRKEG